MEPSLPPTIFYGRRSLILLVAAFGLSFMVSPTALAQKIKLGTLVPRGTSHHQALLKLGQNWKDVSGGKIDLVIYPDGVVGSESAMVKRMRIGQIQASLLTAVGLTEIERAASGLSYFPFTFRSLDELTYVREKLQPMLADRMREQGFEVIFWADSGWITYFSRKPVVVPDDLRAQKMFTWAGQAVETNLVRKMGFKPVPLETAQIYPSLQNGMIDAVAMPPFYALASRIYTFAPHQLEKNYAPMVGACVVTSKTWDKIPADLQKSLKEQARETGTAITEAGRRESEEAVASMQEKWGLKVHDVSPEAEKEWDSLGKTALEDVRGKIVPEDVFDRTMDLLAEYRAKN